MSDRKPCILCVDDEPVNLKLVEAMMLPKGYEVIKAADGADALKKIKEHTIDLLLLDVMMPGMNGFDTCRLIKDDEQYRNIPIIMLTALRSKEDRVKGIAAGADDFISKPADKDELILKCRNMLRMKTYRDELEQKNADLQKLQKVKDSLTAMIVHDLKGPLGCIMGYLQMAMNPKHGLDTKVAEYLNQANVSVSSLSNMISTILDITRMEEGAMKIVKASFSVVDMLGKIDNMFRASVELEEKSLVLKICSDITVTSDCSLIERILQNLVTNALRYTTRGKGIITVSVAEADDNVIFTVEDNGTGIPQEYHEKIFDKFAQVETRGVGAAKGLGLTFCKMAAEALGGRIWVESEFGKGSRFVVEIPVRQTKDDRQ